MTSRARALRLSSLATTLVMVLVLVTACGQQTDGGGPDVARMQYAVQERTRDLYRIHLKLDTAATEIEKSEAAIEAGNASAATFHATEALRAIRDADDAVLDLGRDLQQAVNLDMEKGRP